MPPSLAYGGGGLPSLLFVESQVGVLDRLHSEGRLQTADLALASDWRFSNQLSSAVAEAQADTRIISCEAVDLDADERLKRFLQDISSTFVQRLAYSLGGHFPATATAGLVASIRNQLFVGVRPYFMLMKHVKSFSPSKVAVVARSNSNFAAIDHLLDHASVERRELFCFDRSELTKVEVDERHGVPTREVMRRIRPIPLFEEGFGEKGHVLTITPMSDDRSASIILPLVSGLQSHVPQTLALTTNKGPRAWATFRKSFGVGEGIRLVHKAKVEGPKHVGWSVYSAIVSSIDSLRSELEAHRSDEVKAVAGLVLDGLARISARSVDFALSYDSYCKDSLRGLRGLIVASGETMDAAIAVGNANILGIPTIEVQRGIVAEETVYAAPEARHILCIDNGSREAFLSRSGFDPGSLPLIGSLRQDVETGRFENLNKETARANMPALSVSGSDRVLLLVGQPVDRRIMEDVASVAMKAAASLGDVFVIVKAHHEEDVQGAAIYQELAKKLGLSKFAMVTNRTPECAIAADFVATYYSSVALESVAVGTPVISIKPNGHSPVDFSRIGLSWSASSPDELAALLRNPPKPVAPNPDAAAIYRDGGAKERAVNFVLRQIGGAPAVLRDSEKILTLKQLRFRVDKINAANGPLAALNFLADATQFEELERKWLGAYASLACGLVDPALEGFMQRTIADRTIPIPAGVEPWMGQPLKGKLIVWAQTGIGIGAEVLHLGYLQSLKPLWSRMLLVCDSRLVPIVKRSFPGLPVQGRDEWRKEREKEPARNPSSLIQRLLRRARRSSLWPRKFQYHCSIMSLGWLSHHANGASARSESFVSIRPDKVAGLRSRYLQGEKTKLIGITWKSGNSAQQRRNAPDLPALVSSISGEGVQLVSLQHGVTEEEKTFLRSCGVIVDDAVNPIRNIPLLFDQVGAMDAVVSALNTIGHFSGSIGVPTVLLAPKGAIHEWQTETVAKYWYPVVDVVYYETDEFPRALVAVRSRLDALLS